MTTFNDRTTPLSLLASRRSGKARDLGQPGPTTDELQRMIAIAGRTPDHGKLAPWRFVIVEAEQRLTLRDRLCDIYRASKPDAGRLELEAVDQFALQAPALVVSLFSPRVESHIPLWEQELSAGAATMNLLHAAHAMGYAGSWLTGWAVYSDAVLALFGSAPERIAGFVFVGTPARELEERPRPALEAICSRWQP